MSTGMLNLDMSPSVVNRTALLDLPKAFQQTLSTVLDVRPRFFGRSMGIDAAISDRPFLMGQLGEMLSAPDSFANKLQTRTTGPTFFMDPLYVLFGGVRAEDCVLVLDVSPVTNPAWHRADVSAAYTHAYRRITDAGACCYFISENTRVAFNAVFGTLFGREHVIHLYLPEKRQAECRAGKPRYPFFLFVGSLEKRKNIAGMVQAFRASHLAERGYKLVMVGGNGHGSDELPENFFSDPNIVFTGYLSDARTNELYANASGFLYLSYLEGFGVPILEAMHYGLPIVATSSGAVPEVLGENGFIVDPDDHVGAAASLRKVAELTDVERTAMAIKMSERIQLLFSRRVFDSNVLKSIGQRYA